MINNLRDRTTLNNGNKMPWLGLGVYRMQDGQEVKNAIRTALEIGYRSIDTAAFYQNEAGVGQAIRESGLPREQIFLTTKVWNSDVRQNRVLQAFDESLRRFGIDFVDLYLIHWPVPGAYLAAWKDLEKIYASGRAKAIGVSNFLSHHLEALLQEAAIVPAVNQVEFHPRLVQPDLLAYCQGRQIQVEAWAPLMRGRVLAEPAILKLADRYHKTPAQIVLRWDIQHGVATIPKSTRPDRIAENAQIFDFKLAEEEMQAIDTLDAGQRTGPHPDQVDF